MFNDGIRYTHNSIREDGEKEKRTSQNVPSIKEQQSRLSMAELKGLCPFEYTCVLLSHPDLQTQFSRPSDRPQAVP